MATGIGIADLADAALENIGFFIEPEGVCPPQISSYSYEIDPNITVQSNDVILFLTKVGVDINSSKGRLFTGLQSKRVELFSKAMVLDLLSLTPMLLVSGTVATAASLALFSGISFHYGQKLVSSLRKYDLDQPQIRKEVMEMIKSHTLEEVLTRFSLEEIVKYDLFESRLVDYDKHMRAEFYVKLGKLALDKSDLDVAKNADLLEIARSFEEASDKITSWRVLCSSKISQISWKYLSASLFPLDQAPTEFEKTLTKLVRLSVDWRFEEKMKPWLEWRIKEIKGVEKAYHMALMKLETVYQSIFLGSSPISILFKQKYLQASGL